MNRILIIILGVVASFSLCHAQSDSLVCRNLSRRGVPVTTGNSVRLIKSGHDKFEDMFDEIRNAKSFIHLEYFNFRNDSIANLLFSILADKVREGVEVRAMYDAFGNSSNNQPINHSHHDSISSTGISLVKWDPITFPWVNHIFPRDHRKIVVIDGRVAYTGGMNVADYYVNGLEGIGPWRDLHMHIEGSAVNELNKIFCGMWYEETGELLTGAKYFPEPEKAGDVKMAVVDRVPRRTNKAIRQLYIDMLDNAQRNVRLINPYFVPTKKVRAALRRCIERGIDVQIMISEKGDIPLTPNASHYVGRKMQKYGATVYLFQGGFHHSKMMTVDDTFCTVGSSNLDSRSLRCDYEINTVVFDRDFTAELNDMFREDAGQSVRMSREFYRNKTLWNRFVAWFGNLLTPFL